MENWRSQQWPLSDRGMAHTMVGVRATPVTTHGCNIVLPCWVPTLLVDGRQHRSYRADRYDTGMYLNIPEKKRKPCRQLLRDRAPLSPDASFHLYTYTSIHAHVLPTLSVNLRTVLGIQIETQTILIFPDNSSTAISSRKPVLDLSRSHDRKPSIIS